jgi:hypothetical protein
MFFSVQMEYSGATHDAIIKAEENISFQDCPE